MLIEIGKENNINKLGVVNRVVSLVPSLTETIASLGARFNLCGVTRFCTSPEDIRTVVPTVGGTKNFSVRAVLNQQPDCVVGVKEENTKELILELAEKVPVVLFDIQNVEDALQMIAILGQLLDKNQEAKTMIQSITSGFQKLNMKPEIKPRVLYLIWKDPWMAAGRETFIGEMIAEAGFDNLIPGRYPEVEDETFRQADVILLSSEPYPFTEKHSVTLQKKYPGKVFICVDAKMFSWYGSHLLQVPSYFKKLWAENFRV